MGFFNTDTVNARQETAQVNDRRAELYAPIHRSGMMTWHPRKEVTSMVGGFRLSNGNLGCPWPVDKSLGLRKDRAKLQGDLGKFESQREALEAQLERRRARRRPWTEGGGGDRGGSGGREAPSPDHAASTSALDAFLASGNARTATAASPLRSRGIAKRSAQRAFNPNSSLGKQVLSSLPTGPGPVFGSSDMRNQPQRYWPLTLNRCGSGNHHERVVRLGKDMPHSQWETASTAKFTMGGPKQGFARRLASTNHGFEWGKGNEKVATKFRSDKFRWA